MVKSSFRFIGKKHDVPGEREARESRQRRVALIRRLAKAKQESHRRDRLRWRGDRHTLDAEDGRNVVVVNFWKMLPVEFV